jgi:agmatine deiminase
MPAEWEAHEATWIAWPHESTDWPGKFAPVRWIYAEIVRHLSAHERVRILVESNDHATKARRTLTRAGVTLGAVEFHVCPTNRGWLRDSGPIFVKDEDGGVSVTNWKFTAWAKYEDWKLDDRIPDFVARRLGMAQARPDLVLEGGAIDVNGCGTLMSTEECLLSPVQERNPGVSRERLEAALGGYLGVRHFLWLDRGIAGDDTHGHVDDIARFVGPSTVVAAVEPDSSDDNHEPLRENLQRLRRMRDQDGNALKIVALPMPEPVYFGGQRLPASYANFYIANRVVLVPVFNDPNDRVALNILARCFPDRLMIPIYCRDLVLGLGTLHCLTQQQPR